jgi:flagellar hook-associated protein 1 FlgK
MSLTGTLATINAGLQVTQSALQIVGANVANAQTPGYVRKTLDQVSTAAGSSISVRAADIKRQLDKLIQTQLRTASAGGAYADKLSDLYGQLQTLYGAPGSGTAVDTLFNNFTTALQALSVSPSSFSAQTSVVNVGQQLAQQLNSLSDNIQAMRSAAEQGIAADVQTANNDLQQIATINAQISTANNTDPTTANLLDQRDKYIDELSKLMDIRVVPGDFNQLTVFTGTGTQLVGARPVTLSFTPQGTITPNVTWSSNPAQSNLGTITLTNPGGGSIDLLASGAIQSGEISAYLAMRDKILPQAQTQLDDMAAQMSQAMSDVTTPGTAVTAAPLAGFSVDTAGLLTGNQMSLTYTDASSVQHKVTIVRVDDPTVLPLPQTTTADPNDQVVGVDFSGGMASVVNQLNTALGGAGLNFSNPGPPGSTTLQVLNTLAATATVNAFSTTKTMTSLTSGNPQLPFFVDASGPYSGAITASGAQETGFAQRIRVNSAVLSNPSSLVIYSASPATDIGDNTRPTFLYNQLVSGMRTFSPATGIGSAAMPMTGTLTTFIGQMMTDQAQAASNASGLKQGQDVVVNGLQQRMNSVSGVNIDQEMTSLLNLQNTYAANARVFTVVQQMLQTLMQMGG